MAFLDKLNQVAKNIGDMTSDAIETTKLNSKAASDRLAATEELRKIGEHYYNKFIASGEVDAEVLEFCNKAKEYFDLANETQAEIDRIKAEKEERTVAPIQNTSVSAKVCPSCGMENGEGMNFCQGCGTKLEDVVENQERICSGCGAKVAQNMNFCSVCGQRMEV